MLIARNDRPQWIAGSEGCSKAWSAAGGKTVFHLLPDGGHGFGTAGPMAGVRKDFLSKP